jgi:hypothetical protein
MLYHRRITSVTAMGITLPARLVGAPRFARRALSFSAITLGALLGSGCGGGNAFLSPARNENAERQIPVFALSGTPAGLPTAFQFATESLVRPQVLVSGGVNFDIAFDITTDNRVIIYPVRQLVPQPPAGSPTIGLLRSSASFDAIVRAPDRGYVDDSTFTVGRGEVLLVRARGSGCIYNDPFYAKLVVDTVLPAERRLIFRTVVNRNCGYRALSTGLPKN